MADDNVQHGIDDNPHGDAGKGAVAGALGGAAVGALAGGPIGAVIGAVAGAIASGAAVAAVDAVDNDNTVSGLGGDSTTDANRSTIGTAGYNTAGATNTTGASTNPPDIRPVGDSDAGPVAGATTGANLPDITSTGGTSAGMNPPDIRPIGGTTTGGTTANADLPDITPMAGPDITPIAETPVVAAPQTTHEQTRTDVAPVAAQTNVARTDQTADHIVVPVVEEQLNVQKTMQQTGEVEVSKHVITEQVNVPVEVSREEVVVTRHAVNRDLQSGEHIVGQTEEVLRVPVMEETVSVTKTPHVVGEVEIGKTVETRQENVSDTVRKEVVDINDTTGQSGTTGTSGTTRNNNV